MAKPPRTTAPTATMLTGGAPADALSGADALLGADPPLIHASGERMADTLSAAAEAVAESLDRAAWNETDFGAGYRADRESGYRAAEIGAIEQPRHEEAIARQLSPVAAGPIAAPLPPVRPFGTRATDAPPVKADPAFDRRLTLDALLTHPSAEVRQRAEEARAALHHGAADGGLKMRAAIDTAKVSEATR